MGARTQLLSAIKHSLSIPSRPSDVCVSGSAIRVKMRVFSRLPKRRSVIIPSNPIGFTHKLMSAGDEGRGGRNINSPRPPSHLVLSNFQSPRSAERKSDPPDKDCGSPASGPNRHKKLHGREGQRGNCGKTAAGSLGLCSWAGLWRWRVLRLDGMGDRKMMGEDRAQSWFFFFRWEGLID